MLPHEERLQAFLSRYGEALSAGDLPALVLSDEGSIPVAPAQRSKKRSGTRRRATARRVW